MKFFNNFFHWSIKECSIVDALLRLLTVRQLQDLVAEAKDPRSLVDLAIQKQKLPRKKFLAKLSLYCCFPIKEVDDQELNLDLISLLPSSRLKKLGCFPLIRESAVHGLWCVDPYMAKQSFQETAIIPDDFQFFLGTWQQISTKWEEFSSLEDLKKRTDDYNQQIFQQSINSLADCLIRNSKTKLIIKTSPDAQDERLKELGVDLSVLQIELLKKNLFCQSRLSEIAHPDEGILQVKMVYDVTSEEIEVSIDQKVQTQELDCSEVRIIVVDDSPVFAELIKKYLQGANFQYKVFASSEMALNFLKRSRQKVDLIISDLHMPGLSGSDLLKNIRRLKRLRKTPFALLTSDSSTLSELSLLEQGVNAYLRKDQSPQVIAAHIKNIICQNSMR